MGSVLVYHLGYHWGNGGYLGVDLFFVLSGLLITSLLLEEKVEAGRIALGAFWGRRARRLLPALFLMVIAAVAVPYLVSQFGDASSVAGIDIGLLHGFGIASFFYFANWYVISSGHSYFAAFAAPSPLAHTWSLAIEEQFYVFWPLLTLWLTRRGVREMRRIGLAICLGIAVVSSALMAIIFSPGDSNSENFVYNATFTRLFDLALGAALAWVVVANHREPLTRRAANLVGSASLVALAAFMVFAGGDDGVPWNFMFRGGFLLCALFAVMVLAAVRVDGSWLARLFSWRPLRAVGQVSYGIYLWHWPVIVLVTPSLAHVGGKKLLLLRLALITVLTLASYFFVEQPIRQRRWRARDLAAIAALEPTQQPRERRRRAALRTSVAGLGSGATLAAVIVFTLPSLFPTPSIRAILARYAPANSTVVNGVVGSVSAATLRAISPERPGGTGVVIEGDSVAYYAGPGLTAAANSIPGVHAQFSAFVGFGLRNTEHLHNFYDGVARAHAQVVVFLNAYDDLYASVHPGQYLLKMENFARGLYQRGVKLVIFASTPIQHSPSFLGLSGAAEARWERPFDTGRLNWNQAAIATTEMFEGRALFAPLGDTLDLAHKYSAWLPPPRRPLDPRSTWDRVRMIDGAHFCAPGTEIYGAGLVSVLRSAMNDTTPSTTRWWLGNWPHFKFLFFGPTASWCPIDHPR